MKSEKGSVTAELAVVLPALIGIVLLMLQLSAWQINRAQLVVAAGVAARGASHLMTHIEVANLVDKIAPGASTDISTDGEIVCATLSKSGLLPLEEKICTRVQGQ